MKTGEIFVVDDWNSEVTRRDLDHNDFAGSNGPVSGNGGLITVSTGRAQGNGFLRIGYDFSGGGGAAFAGYFLSLLGPAATAPFLNAEDLYGEFLPLDNRDLERLSFAVNPDARLTLKIELSDSSACRVFTRRVVEAGSWQTISLSIPADFPLTQNCASPATFDWRRVAVLSLVVEQSGNPVTAEFLLDDLVLHDSDGMYPDLAQAGNGAGGLQARYERPFLDWIRATSSLYFLDWAGNDFGLIQDRSTSPLVATVGGVGFQLTAYVVAAERGYIDRGTAAAKTLTVLRNLDDYSQGSDSSGAGYQGFFYHFLRTDGMDLEAATGSEVSTIDTALAIAGIITAAQYFDGSDATESQIRSLADAIYRRVDWSFMLEPSSCQFYLGWKPQASTTPSFQIPDGDGEGFFSGAPGGPQTLDQYTDEALLVALLARASPESTHRVVSCPGNPGRRPWDAIQRQGEPFVKSSPGSLFTYQFASVWINTAQLGTDNHADRPLNLYLNSREATLAAVQYATDNPLNRASLGPERWGLSAAEGPFDEYFAFGAPPLALFVPPPQKIGTVAPYAMGSAIVHLPGEAIAGLWEVANRVDLDGDNDPDLFHPRFGLADAFNLEIADAVFEGQPDCLAGEILRCDGPWVNTVGFAIDHGPMLVMIDNYLSGVTEAGSWVFSDGFETKSLAGTRYGFVPELFMNYLGVRQTLNELDSEFPGKK